MLISEHCQIAPNNNKGNQFYLVSLSGKLITWQMIHRGKMNLIIINVKFLINDLGI